MKNPQLNSLMNKEVSRKEFMGMAVLTAGSVMGFGTVIKLLTGKSLATPTKRLVGYGRSGYGR